MIDVLPFEVLLQIFALLSFFDVLQCMLVSRQWHNSVLYYVTDFPGYIVLNGRRDYRGYARSMARVGAYVRSMVLKNYAYHSETDSVIESLILPFFPNVSTLCKWML